ncbi:TRAP transporter small permease [Sulfitobacter sp. 1A16808]|uniref:TRAP transporter small permease n=1 Tax=Sulfitobacter sp. 1A16808 TaxID=3368572 RepID=UPI0037471E72
MYRLTPFNILRHLIVLLLGGLVFLVFSNIALRMTSGTSLVATEELSRIMMIWLVFLGAVLVLHEGRHISMLIAVEKMPPRLQLLMALVGGALMILCDYLLLRGAWRQMHFAASDSFAVTGLPMSVVYLPGVLAAGIFIAITAVRMVGLILGRRTPESHFGFDHPVNDPE